MDIAELNNALYSFHPSFDLFHLYSLLLPLKPEYAPVFAQLEGILEKCLRSNIVTPLLFGLLRHRLAFKDFIEQAQSEVWLPYLNTIIGAIAINFKLRILEYE